jgi:hypothetical protein
VELLVVVIISLIVTGVGFSIYRMNASYYMREDAYLEQYQNLRVSLFTLARDIRMAGNGYSLLGPDVKLIQVWSPTREIPYAGGNPPTEISVVSGSTKWFYHSDSLSGAPGVRGLYGVDGGENNPDTITLFRAEVESGNPLGRVKDLTGGELEMDAEFFQEAVQPGDIIVVASGLQAIILETDDDFHFSAGKATKIPLKNGGRFTRNSSDFFPTGFPLTGAQVWNFRDVLFVTYYVDESNNQLMADYHDTAKADYDSTKQTQVVAYNIEDLQFYYFYDTDTVDNSLISTAPLISSSILDSKRVKAVTIGVVSRSPRGEGPGKYFRPAFFNRDAGDVYDNHPRTSLVETVYVRNYHL